MNVVLWIEIRIQGGWVWYLELLNSGLFISGSGLGSVLLGVAYFANIHVLYYFILVQLATGAAQVRGRGRGREGIK